MRNVPQRAHAVRVAPFPARPVPASRSPRCPRIVAIGGGTGLPIVLRGLADALEDALGSDHHGRCSDALTAIVTVSDDGGSSGRLRRDLGMLPPGDIRNCLAALAANPALGRLLDYRFDGPTDLEGHPVGNLMLAAMARVTGSFASGVDELGRLFGARGRVFPVTVEDVSLRAEMTNGEIVEGETSIVGHRAAIRRLALARQVRPCPEALRALINADAVVVGPGSLYTSVLPNLLVDGVASTLSAVCGVRIAVANLMTQPGETDGMSLTDHLRVLREHTGRDLFDYILVNATPPTPAQIRSYRSDGADLIPCTVSPSLAGRARIVMADLLDTTSDQIRHDSGKLASTILDIVRRASARQAHTRHLTVSSSPA